MSEVEKFNNAKEFFLNVKELFEFISEGEILDSIKGIFLNFITDLDDIASSIFKISFIIGTMIYPIDNNYGKKIGLKGFVFYLFFKSIVLLIKIKLLI